MLTLNTNAWWNWSFVMANQNLWDSSMFWYPNFDMLLLHPAGEEIHQTTTAITGWPVVHSVNWTPINNWWSNLVRPYCKIWALYYAQQSTSYTSQNRFWIYWAIFTVSTYNSSPTVSRRFWIPLILSWWELIWRYCIWSFNFFQYSPNTYVKIHIWLLHTDWTIDYIWEEQTISDIIIWGVWVYQNWYSSYCKKFSFSNTPVQAQEWDIVIADITVYLVNTSSSYININFWNEWWSMWCNSSGSNNYWYSWPACPIQISLE